MEDRYCLVLGGGGAKGVFHVGALRALRELGIELEAVVGNSIGAVVAAFVAQSLDSELEEISNRIGLDYILNIPDELIKDGELSINLSHKEAFRKFYRKISSDGGLDTSPLRKLLDDHIDEKKIRENGLDFGVVTFNTSNMKPRQVFVEEMEEGELISYAMASSAFPGFQQPEIAGKKYIDGGVYNNVPFTMARSRGYRNIIVVDISGFGVNRKPDIIGTRTVYIKNSINMGWTLDFDREFLDRFTTLGYLDTMKAFGRYRGVDYFIEPEEKQEEAFGEFIRTEAMQQRLFTLPGILAAEDSPRNIGEAMMKLLPKKRRHDPNWLPLLADCAAGILAVDRVQSWSYSELFDVLKKKTEELEQEAESIKNAGGRAFIGRIRKEIRDKQLSATPYVYHLLGDMYLPRRLRESLEKFIIHHHPQLAAGVFFLDILDEFRAYLEGARV